MSTIAQNADIHPTLTPAGDPPPDTGHEETHETLGRRVTARRAALDRARAQLRREFIGIEDTIDAIIENITPWYLFPELLEHPTVINLWGMTGVGKTALVRRLIELIAFGDRFFRFDLGDTRSAWSFTSTISEMVDEVSPDHPLVVCLDEFQVARTLSRLGDPLDDPNRVVWDLLDGGRIRVYRGTNFGFNHLVSGLQQAIAGGMQIEPGGLISQREDLARQHISDQSLREVRPGDHRPPTGDPGDGPVAPRETDVSRRHRDGNGALPPIVGDRPADAAPKLEPIRPTAANTVRLKDLLSKEPATRARAHWKLRSICRQVRPTTRPTGDCASPPAAQPTPDEPSPAAGRPDQPSTDGAATTDPSTHAAPSDASDQRHPGSDATDAASPSLPPLEPAGTAPTPDDPDRPGLYLRLEHGILEFLLERHGRRLGASSIDEVAAVISELDGYALLDLLERLRVTSYQQVEIRFSRLLVFAIGNLDEAFDMADELTSDVDPDLFHQRTLEIGLPEVKQALQKRFRAEQIARLGNTHLIFRAIRRDSYRRFIDLRLREIAGRIGAHLGIGISVAPSLAELLFREGVFPTQGFRPLESTIRELLTTRLVGMLHDPALWDQGATGLVLSAVGNRFVCEFQRDGQTIGTCEQALPTPLSDRRQARSPDVAAVAAVHEGGHVTLLLALLGQTPPLVTVNCSDPHRNGMTCRPVETGPQTRRALLAVTAVFLAGAMAEAKLFGRGRVTGGNESDIAAATRIATSVIRSGGFGRVPARHSLDPNDDQTIHTPRVEDEVEAWIRAARRLARRTLRRHHVFLVRFAATLAERGTLDRTAIDRLWRDYRRDDGLRRSARRICAWSGTATHQARPLIAQPAPARQAAGTPADPPSRHLSEHPSERRAQPEVGMVLHSEAAPCAHPAPAPVDPPKPTRQTDGAGMPAYQRYLKHALSRSERCSPPPRRRNRRPEAPDR